MSLDTFDGLLRFVRNNERYSYLKMYYYPACAIEQPSMHASEILFSVVSNYNLKRDGYAFRTAIGGLSQYKLTL